jgi:hypothetical protein
MNDQPDDLTDQVRTACQDLVRQGSTVTFSKIAERTGISRATLYRRPELREIVDAHRNRDSETPTITGLVIQIDQLRQTLEAVAANVRRHEEDLRVLKRASRQKKK